MEDNKSGQANETNSISSLSKYNYQDFDKWEDVINLMSAEISRIWKIEQTVICSKQSDLIERFYFRLKYLSDDANIDRPELLPLLRWLIIYQGKTSFPPICQVRIWLINADLTIQTSNKPRLTVSDSYYQTDLYNPLSYRLDIHNCRLDQNLVMSISQGSQQCLKCCQCLPKLDIDPRVRHLILHVDQFV